MKLFAGQAEGIDHDVTIEFNGSHFNDGRKIMKLHKLFLQQSSYLAEMFEKDGTNFYQIDITDEKITERSLVIILKSLYTEIIEFRKTDEELISLLATAHKLALDSISKQIAGLMFDRVEIKNMVPYYYAFKHSGYREFEEKLFNRLVMNFSDRQWGREFSLIDAAAWQWGREQANKFPMLVLPLIEKDLMGKLITNEKFIVKSEFNIFDLLLRWLEIQLNFQIDVIQSHTPFLNTKRGKEFKEIFSKLNLNDLVMLDNGKQRVEMIFPLSSIINAEDENHRKMVQLSNHIVEENIPDKIYRFGIDLNNYFIREFYGVRLSFQWEKNWLTVMRLRSKKHPFVNPVDIKLRIVMTPTVEKELLLENVNLFKEFKLHYHKYDKSDSNSDGKLLVEEIVGIAVISISRTKKFPGTKKVILSCVPEL
jgi:hypothetical protein